MSDLIAEVAAKRDRLLAVLAGYGSCAVAFSGGVDSAVVAKAAQLALGERAVAVTGISHSLAEGELAKAEELAKLIGIRHRVVATDEFANADYRRNATDRCFHCKTELYTKLVGLKAELDVAIIANGANADDLGEFRPGMNAARQHAVRSPLVECEIAKDDVRRLAAHWRLPTWDKPATPCLSSRVAYGEEVTPQRLAMIDRAEQLLRGMGLVEMRVRYHKGDLARIEVPVGELARMAAPAVRQTLVEQFRSLGFKFVTLDLEGFRSGSLNQLVPLAALSMGPPPGGGSP